jgi:hypothetical protein
MSTVEKRLAALEKKIDLLLLNKGIDTSQLSKDGKGQESKKVPVQNRQGKVKPVDFKTFYKKRGIV